MRRDNRISAKVYTVEEIQQLLGIGRTKSMHTSKACIKPRNRSGLSKLADHTGSERVV